MPDKAKLLEELQRVADQLDKPPTIREMKEHGEYSVSPYRSEFGSWSNALKEAGYDLRRSGRQYNPDQLLDELHRLAVELGKRPTVKDLRKHGKYSISPYRDHFGSWSSALEMAGFEVKSKPRRSKQDYLEELQRLADELGHPPRIKDMADQGNYSSSPYEHQFDSWTDALETAGMDPEWYKVDQEDLIDELQRVAEEYRSPPTRKIMNQHGEYSHPTYRSHFGSWKAALEAAGFETSDIPGPGGPITDEELLEELQSLAEELGHSPSLREYRNNGSHAASTYYNHFGSWKEALQAAGFEPRKGQQKIPGEDLIAELQRLAEELDKVPFKREMNEHGNHHPETYLRRFGSWSNAIEAAGFEGD